MLERVLFMARRGENIYKRKDGRWEGRYIKGRHKNGKIHYGYIYGYKYTEVKHQLILTKYEKQTSSSKNLLPYEGGVIDWTNYWLETFVRPKVKSSTYASYKNKMEVQVLPIIGSIKLQELKASDIDSLVKKMEETLKASSIRSIFSVLKNSLSKAKSLNLLSENPCMGLELPKMRKKTVQALSIKDQTKLLKEIKANQKFSQLRWPYRQDFELEKFVA